MRSSSILDTSRHSEPIVEAILAVYQSLRAAARRRKRSAKHKYELGIPMPDSLVVTHLQLQNTQRSQQHQQLQPASQRATKRQPPIKIVYIINTVLVP